MKDRVLAALVTVIVFAAGFWAGRWHESTRPVPPPPGVFLGEFGPPGVPRTPGSHEPINRGRLAAEIEKIKPQVEDFRAKMAEIDAQFDRNLEKVLSPEQRKIREDHLKRHGEDRHSRGSVPEGDKPLTDEEIATLLRGPLYSVFRNVVIPVRLDLLTRELKLDDTQREQVRDLLRVHREKFLELIDAAPPPSISLSRLAPMAQRLSGSPAGPQPAPQPVPAKEP
jgi:hypothetical protein